jgi:hypothetical protein
MPARSRTLTTAKVKRSTASAVTNGSRLLTEGNNGSAWARRYKDLCLLHVDDLGGADAVTEAQISLVRRCSAIEVELERLEGLMSRGAEIDLDLFARVSGTLSRMLRALGLERKTPDAAATEAQRLLDQYAAEDAAKQESAQ